LDPNSLTPPNPNKIEVSAAPSGAVELLLLLLVVGLLLLGGMAVYSLYKNSPGRRPFLNRASLQRGVAILFFSALALYCLWSVRDILPPFLIAFFVASLLDPVVTRIQKRGVARGRVVASIFGLVIAGVALAAILIVPRAADQMKEFAVNAPRYSSTFTEQADKLYERNQTSLQKLGMANKPSFYLKDGGQGPLAAVTQNVLNTVTDALVGFAGRILWLVIIPLSLFYFLLDFQIIRAKLISFIPHRQRAGVDKMSQEVVEIFSQYIRGLTKVCIFYAIAAVVLFSIFGLQYALFLGLAAGVLYAVPYVGPLVAMSGAAVIALSMGKGPGFSGLVVAAFLAMHVAFDYGVTPRVVGGSVGLHPLVNVFALMVGATLFGVWGMLLAVPVAASIQMLLIYFFPKLAETPVLPSEEPESVTGDEAPVWREEREREPLPG
jgi:predicted PurR-regulated permease PerM